MRCIVILVTSAVAIPIADWRRGNGSLVRSAVGKSSLLIHHHVDEMLLFMHEQVVKLRSVALVKGQRYDLTLHKCAMFFRAHIIQRRLQRRLSFGCFSAPFRAKRRSFCSIRNFRAVRVFCLSGSGQWI